MMKIFIIIIEKFINQMFLVFFKKTFVFEMSIRDNLSLIDSNYKNQIEACKRIRIHDFIMSLPKGYNTIIKSKPGITGYWQVNVRSGTDFVKRLVLDEYYYQVRCLVMDTKILLKTFTKVFNKEGAK